MGVKPGYKQTEMGIIPEEWDAKAIGTEIDLLTGFPFPSSGYSKAGVRLLRGSNIKRGQTDWSDEITKYWPAVTRDLIRYTMMAGDLVVSMDGSLVGRSFAQLEESDLPALLLQRVARIRGTKLDVTYLRQFVGSDQFVKYVDSVKTVTAIPHISPSDIRKFTIPLPPTLPEQRVIATALSDVDSLLSVLDRLTAKKRDLKQAAMQQLLTGKTRLPGFHGEWEVRSLAAICSMKSGEGITSANIDQFSKYPCYGGNGLRKNESQPVFRVLCSTRIIRVEDSET
jgi:type I restriction enzyme S subunit